jgi:hypothetical protein
MEVRAFVLIEQHRGSRRSVEIQKVLGRVGISNVVIASLLFLIVTTDIGQATTIVSPQGYENIEGSSFGGAPTSFARVQYLYPASDFSSLSQHQLVGIAWRPDQTTGPTTTSTSNFQLRVSTTSATELNSIFASNVGANEALVFDGPLTISTAADQLPREFDFTVEFQTPFLYDPTKGNLLVDFTTTGFDADGWRVDNESTGGPITLVQSVVPSESVAPFAFSALAVMQFAFAPTPNNPHGDYNADGKVDAADYVVWRKGLGTAYTQTDYDAWRANFGKSAGSGAAGYPLGASVEPLPAAIPEPHSLAIAAIAFLALRSCLVRHVDIVEVAFNRSAKRPYCVPWPERKFGFETSYSSSC